MIQEMLKHAQITLPETLTPELIKEMRVETIPISEELKPKICKLKIN